MGTNEYFPYQTVLENFVILKKCVFLFLHSLHCDDCPYEPFKRVEERADGSGTMRTAPKTRYAWHTQVISRGCRGSLAIGAVRERAVSSGDQRVRGEADGTRVATKCTGPKMVDES
jgi:hypothetical protein